MTAPNVRPINLFPAQMVPTTYPEYVGKLQCTCSGGALIRPSPLPSATKNLGDVIASFSQSLSSFTAIYGMITVVMRMMSCIIDILCALMNPFAVISAVIKLFGTCLPDFILIFPQFAIPAIIICIIKIILAVIEYILTVIVPLINEIIKNIQMVIDAFANNNRDAQLAIAFKIASLWKELQNILGIIAALGALWEMIKALLNLGIALPCSGSEACCNDANCPNTIKNNTTFSGVDGVLSIGIDTITFSASSIASNFIEIRNFFPAGLDYSKITDKERLPYTLEIEGATFAIISVDENGVATGITFAGTPSGGSSKTFTFEINHTELLRYNLIGVGCHPAVKTTLQGVENRFPQIQDTTLPALPDIDALTACLTNCMTAVAPLNITSEWVLDNYSVMATNIITLNSCISGCLNNFKNNMIDYVGKIIDKILDVEISLLAADPATQVIGSYININVVPLDRNGAKLTLGLPPGMAEVEINVSEGTLSPTTEILDSYGLSTGAFGATLTSLYPVTSRIGATIDGYNVAYFDGYALQPRYIYVNFVEPSDLHAMVEGSTEPLGVGRS